MLFLPPSPPHPKHHCLFTYLVVLCPDSYQCYPSYSSHDTYPCQCVYPVLIGHCVVNPVYWSCYHCYCYWCHQRRHRVHCCCCYSSPDVSNCCDHVPLSHACEQWWQWWAPQGKCYQLRQLGYREMAGYPRWPVHRPMRDLRAKNGEEQIKNENIRI